MAVIGEQLTSPEEGWKRYDDTDPRFKYDGKWTVATGNSNYYNSSNHVYNTTTIEKASVQFIFSGTKLRLIGRMDGVVEIIIDDNTYSIENQRAAKYQMLYYEKTDLALGSHKVTINYLEDTGSVTDFDAIDIDSDGKLLHPDEVLTPNELAIGKRIRCHYSATVSGQVGTFSGLGEETSDFIPAASSATPDGDFYFIMVNDGYGGKKLIADRNVQHNISWDTLNSAGISSGSGLPLDLGTQSHLFTTRLLTGGISSSDKDNEWDLYIVNSDLNGAITPGDNEVWNWSNQYAWTSTTASTSSEARAFRGMLAASTWASGLTTQSRAFRPVLLVESTFTPTTKYLIDDGGALKKWMNGSWSSVTGQPNEALFQSDGMNDLSSIPEEAWSQLGSTFDILTYTDSGKTNESFTVEYQDKEKVSRTATLKAVPHNKLIMPKGDIEIGSLEKVTLNATVPGDGVLKVIVSGDGGVTWKSVKGGGSNAIPIMKSDTSPSGIASASSIENSNTSAWKAFDNGADYNLWSTSNGILSGWLAYEFPLPTVITEYIIKGAGSYSPYSWSFEGFNGVGWDVLDVRDEVTFNGYEIKSFTFTNIKQYKKYRINVSKNGGNTSYLRISELMMVESNALNEINPKEFNEIKANGLSVHDINNFTKEQLSVLLPNSTARFAFYIEQANTTDTIEIESLMIDERLYTLSPNVSDLTVFSTILKDQDPAFYVSRNDGTDWKEITKDELHSLEDLPEGKTLRVKAVLQNGEEVTGLSYSWI